MELETLQEIAPLLNKIPPSALADLDKIEDLGLKGIEDRKTQKVSDEDLTRAVDVLNETSRVYDRGIRFSVDEETGRRVVSIINRETDEVVRTIPSEQMLDLVAAIHNLMGVMMDKKA
ncbi:MAG: flagellar protein FlaG [bacterium]|nr:flagellar protein FlaG [bacterium]